MDREIDDEPAYRLLEDDGCLIQGDPWWIAAESQPGGNGGRGLGRRIPAGSTPSRRQPATAFHRDDLRGAVLGNRSVLAPYRGEPS